MINLFGPLRHTNLWSVAAFDKDGDGGGGGGDDGGSDGGGTRSEADIQKDINNALAESGGQWTSEINDDGTAGYTKAAAEAAASSLASNLGTTVNDTTFEFEGPMPGGQAGYMQDVSRIGVDRDTGFLTGEYRDDDDGVGMTTGTPLDTSVGIESLLPPPPPSGPRATDVYDSGDDDFTYQGPTFTGPGYTQDVTQMDVDRDTGFITDDRGVDYTPPPAVAVDEFSGLLPSMTDQFYTPLRHSPRSKDRTCPRRSHKPLLQAASPGSFKTRWGLLLG
jgi:hypothetical protein